jgi:endonuclease/exonuclease/phosphatase family metal-dependent hydrolase
VTLTVATYNVHRCIGTDGRHDPDRIAAVVRETGAEVVGLQEVDSAPRIESGVDQIVHLSQATGLHAVSGPTLQHHAGDYGNALLTRLPVTAFRLIDVSVSGREPRGAIDADVVVGATRCRVIVSHFGLRARERRVQRQMLCQALIRHHGATLTLVLADLNEWARGRRLLDGLMPGFGTRAVPSFPTRWPLFAIDRVLVRPAGMLGRVRAHRSALARVASDHLPVVAEIDLGA